MGSRGSYRDMIFNVIKSRDLITLKWIHSVFGVNLDPKSMFFCNRNGIFTHFEMANGY
jgi:hypothetical protein